MAQVVLPAPEGPVRKWKLPGASASDTPLNNQRPLYPMATFSSSITPAPRPRATLLPQSVPGINARGFPGGIQSVNSIQGRCASKAEKAG